MTSFNTIRALVLSALGTIATAAYADPVEVSWVTSGQAGNWTVEFTVHNNLQPGAEDMTIYQFGVYTAARDITGSPTGWDPDYRTVWDDRYAFYPYNNIWHKDPDSGFVPGTSVSGFTLNVATQTEPTAFNWFAFAISPTGGLYDGTGQVFGGAYNPAFQYTTNAAVPEPAAGLMLLIGGGLVALQQAARRRKATA